MSCRHACSSISIVLLQLIPVILILQRAAVEVDRAVPAAGVSSDASDEWMDAQLIVLADGRLVDTVYSKFPA
jgi:hypothetical protein